MQPTKTKLDRMLERSENRARERAVEKTASIRGHATVWFDADERLRSRREPAGDDLMRARYAEKALRDLMGKADGAILDEYWDPSVDAVRVLVLRWAAEPDEFGRRLRAEFFQRHGDPVTPPTWPPADTPMTRVYFAVAKDDAGDENYGAAETAMHFTAPEDVWKLQGNNPDGFKLWPEWWSLSMGDIVELPDGTRWTPLAAGWAQVDDEAFGHWKAMADHRDRRWPDEWLPADATRTE